VPVWICDVNGVLIDSTVTVHQAFAATARHFGFSFADRDFQNVKGLWLLEAYRILDPGGSASMRREFHLRYVRERAAEIHAYPHVYDVLAAARAAGVRVGAATSHGEIAEACLVHAGLYPLIDCLVTQEEVKRPKPHPDSIVRVLSLLGMGAQDVSRGSAICVGDAVVDIEAGKAAGVCTVGTTYGVSREAEIRAAAPDHVIDSFRELELFLPHSIQQTVTETNGHASGAWV
jgi:HAD superfamily hydrolase (TIGR01509 family)